ncbi:hypothetical protein [Modestobacter roseus]|uniref:DUF3592 domain-containing protein n=1 Tax=Modestobacter roseus TaxID=1181884 RepID=A0A562IL06_9ACTN|nr:hypothetical protein [Modestobacter roseus]MQA34498.1 hypothetical protein [Modestobacter roseus]TWH71552.1 hypothetical protein JD78_00049 [Modestobacter roseus]
MSAPPLPRPHRRAVHQLLLGLLPVLVVGAVALVLLGLRLAELRAPLAAADTTVAATVTGVGAPPEGRGLVLRFPGPDGTERTGRLELPQAQDVPVGAQVAVRYDASAADGEGPVPLYADGDATSAGLTDVVFGLVVVAVVLLVAAALTAGRLLGRPRLRRRPATRVTAAHLVLRQGLLVRSWLELSTSAGLRWLPVHWAPEVDRLVPDTAVEVRGDPARDGLVLPVLDGAELWPSGRLRRRPPRGELRPAPVDPAAGGVGLLRQARADAVLPFGAPGVGLLWAYVMDSGVGGFVLATAVSAAVLFWLPQLLGSDPVATRAG